MSPARFRFYAELNDFLPPARRQRELDYRVNRRAAIKDVIEALGVPHTEVALILVNGEPVGFDHILGDGERVSVFPAFRHLGAAPDNALQPAPPDPPRFVLDTHLGTLARYLRLLGFDTLYRNDYDDAELAGISSRDDRILLTRDRGLLKRRIVERAYFVRADSPRRQLREVAHRFALRSSARPFRRCSRCNGQLHAVDKAAIADLLAPRTRRYYERFLQCGRCGQIYWAGSHFKRLRELLAAIGEDHGGIDPPPR